MRQKSKLCPHNATVGRLVLVQFYSSRMSEVIFNASGRDRQKILWVASVQDCLLCLLYML